MSVVSSFIETIEWLTPSILRLFIKPEPYIHYFAGQYLQIECGQTCLSYSIANAPLGTNLYEVHIRYEACNSQHQMLLEHIQTRKLLLHVPLGGCYFQKLNTDPIIFIAGGTGFAPIKAMIEQLQTKDPQRLIELFWVVRNSKEIYMEDILKKWQAEMPNFYYATFISRNTIQTTLVKTLLEKHKDDLLNYQFVIGGPFEMARFIQAALLQINIKQEQLYSDAFMFDKGET